MGRRYILKRTPRHYVERDKEGQFKNYSSIGRSLSQDRRIKSRTMVKSGYGHLGDIHRPMNVKEILGGKKKIAF